MELRIEKNIVIAVSAVVFALTVFGLAYVGFTYYKGTLSAKAHDIFMMRYSEYQKLSADNKTPNQDLIEAVTAGYKEYKNSAYAPFFLALQAELQDSLGNKQEALNSMTTAVNGMSSVDPVLYYTYVTKLALMQLESADPALQTKGRQSLEKLALNAKNPMHDMAWFYMGYQALLEKDDQGVQTAWGRLFDAQKNPLSIWGMRAQSLLNYTA
jgi:hypothetical protein